jgi:hypothetical protein
VDPCWLFSFTAMTGIFTPAYSVSKRTGSDGGAARRHAGPQGLVEAFDLAGGGRAADPSAHVGDVVFGADAVEQDLGRVRAEAAGDRLGVVGEDFLGDAVAGQGLGEDPAHAVGVGPLDEPGGDAKGKWSSIPVTALSWQPSASQIPPMTSSCHSSMGRVRSQRR